MARYNALTQSIEAPPPAPTRTKRTTKPKATSPKTVSPPKPRRRVTRNPKETGANGGSKGEAQRHASPLATAAASVPLCMFAHLTNAPGTTPTAALEHIRTAFATWCEQHANAHADWRKAWEQYESDGRPSTSSAPAPSAGKVIEVDFTTTDLLQRISALA